MPNLLEEDSRTLLPQFFADSLVQIFQKHSTHGIIPTRVQQINFKR